MLPGDTKIERQCRCLLPVSETCIAKEPLLRLGAVYPRHGSKGIQENGLPEFISLNHRRDAAGFFFLAKPAYSSPEVTAMKLLHRSLMQCTAVILS